MGAAPAGVGDEGREAWEPGTQVRCSPARSSRSFVEFLPPAALPAPGCPGGNRTALSRVLTAKWPAPGSRASTVPGAPSRRYLEPSAGRMEAGAQGRRRGRFGGDARAGFSDRAVRFLLFWALGVFEEKTHFFQLGKAMPRVAERKGHLEERSCSAHHSAPAPLTQFLGP